jgi:hypothetical protein
VETVNGYVKFLAAQGFASGPLAALQREWKTFVENEVQGKRQRQIMVTALVQNGLKALAALGGGGAIDQDEREKMQRLFHIVHALTQNDMVVDGAEIARLISSKFNLRPM